MNNAIYSTNEFDVYQDDRKRTLFTITNKNNSTISNTNLFNSIIETKIINNPTILYNNSNNKGTTTTTTMVFKALSVESFDQFKERNANTTGSNKLSYEIGLNIICSLSRQIDYLLKKESKCFYRLEPSNILVIDSCKFIYLSCEDLKDVKKNNIHIYTSISKTQGYLSPELKTASSIPILVNFKTIFYSLGLFISDNIDDLLCIKDTKLYHFLKRCLSNEANKRFLLYV
jgi:hypothetical protein